MSDTWTWTGNTWSQLIPSVSPSAREVAGLANDPATNQLVLFGGGFAYAAMDDTWQLEESPTITSAMSATFTVGTAGRSQSSPRTLRRQL